MSGDQRNRTLGWCGEALARGFRRDDVGGRLYNRSLQVNERTGEDNAAICFEMSCTTERLTLLLAKQLDAYYKLCKARLTKTTFTANAS